MSCLKPSFQGLHLQIEIFLIYYFLAKPLTLLAHEEFCIVFFTSDERTCYMERHQQFRSSEQFFECAKSYLAPHDALKDTDKDMDMKEVISLIPL